MNLVLQVSALGMSPGNYQTSITVNGGSTPVTIPVMLTVAVGTTGGLAITPASVSFTQTGTTAPASQTLLVTSSLAANFTATPGASWLSVTPTNATTPATLTLSINPASLTNGTSQTSLTINAGGAPVAVPITITVSGATPPGVTVTPALLSFMQTLGGTAASPQTLQLASSPATSFTVSTSGATWLSATPTSGTTPAAVTISVNPAGLTVGPYQASVTITGGGSSATVPITLTVSAAAGTTVNVTPTILAFTGSASGQAPAAQSLAVASSGTSFGFSAASTTNSGGNWLAVAPGAATTPSTLSVTVTPAGLATGQYSGTIVITPGDSTIPVQTVPVTLTVTASSTGGGAPVVLSVLNAASLQPGTISPGEIITITGSGLGPTPGVGATVLPSGAVSTSVAGTQVLFDAIPAPLLYVSANQINAVVPYGIFGRVGSNVTVSVSGAVSAAIDMGVSNTAPGIFTISSTGTGQGAIVNQDATVNSPTFAAPRGSYISIYATGEGQTVPPGQDGRIISTDLRSPVAAVAVTIGGVPINVLYAGSAPGLVSGVLQINVQIPATLTPGGQLPVLIQIGGVLSQAGVTMAVK